MRRTRLLLLAVAFVPACHRQETAATAEQAVLARQRQGLQTLLAASRAGALVPFHNVLVVADERVVAQVVAASLPFERVIRDRYRIRVTRAEAHFEDGFALVRLDGEASFSDRPAGNGHAELTVYGGLDVVELDPQSGVLHGRVNVIAVDARRVGAYGVQSSLAEKLVEELGREKLETFGALVSKIDIPVKLERSVTVPAVGPGDVHIDAATIPLQAAVTDVKAFRRKLWVSVDVSAASPAPPASPGSPVSPAATR